MRGHAATTIDAGGSDSVGSHARDVAGALAWLVAQARAVVPRQGELLALTVRLPHLPPGEATARLAAAELGDDAPLAAWCAPGEAGGIRWELVGRGEAARLDGWEAGGLAEVRRRGERLLSRVIEQRRDEDLLAPAPRLWGGVAFRPDRARRERGPWRDFADVSFALPRWLLGSAEGEAGAFLRLTLSPGERPQRVAEDHVGGLSILTRCLVARRPVVLVAGDRFDPARVLAALRRDRATLISLVPTTLRALLAAADASALASPRAVLLGGAAAPRPLLDEAAARHVRVLTTYGLTEACSQVTAQRPGSGGGDGSGWPLPGVEVRIVEEAGAGAICAAGEVGRVLVNGPVLLEGFLGEPPRDGAWLDTGDLGSLDDTGELHLAARRTDLIVSGGENVYPAEVEAALLELPGVAAALVVGLPDDRWGQRVAALLVLDPPATVAAVEVAVATRLAPFKRPRRYRLVPAIPLTTAGKPDRTAAADLLGRDAQPG